MKQLVSKPRWLISVLAITTVPLLYGALYLWAFWDPYAQLKDLPVAVVNNDAGTVLANESYNFGNDLVTKLAEDKTVAWQVIAADTAKTELEKGEVAAILTLPADLSTDVVSATTDSPVKASVRVQTRPASNFLGAQLSDRIVKEVVNSFNQKINEEFWRQFYNQLADVGAGMQQAADGATTITGHLEELNSGVSTLVGGVNKLQSGSVALNSGVTELSTGAENLATGLSTLSNGSATLLTGTKQLQSSLPALQTGAATVYGGMSQLSSGLSQLSNQSAALVSGNNQLNTAAQTTKQALTALGAANPSLASSTDYQTAVAAVNSLVSGLAGEKSGLNQVGGALQTMSSQSGQLVAGQQSVTGGLAAVKTAVDQLVAGNQQLNGGLQQSAAGATTLASGAQSLKSGSKQLADGLTTMQTETKPLTSGVPQLIAGETTLAGKLAQGQLEIAQKTNQSKVDSTAPVLANPIKLVDNSTEPLPNYGTGLAPYFLPLALWVGGLVSLLIVPIKTAATNDYRRRTFARFGVVSLVALIQVGLLSLVVLKVLKLKVAALGVFIVLLIFTALAFAAVQSLLLLLFDDVGRFLGIVLLMLQLTSAAGTFPLKLLAPFFTLIHNWLPMSYAVNGLREAIVAGSVPVMVNSLAVLGGFALVPLLLIYLIAPAASQRKGWSVT